MNTKYSMSKWSDPDKKLQGFMINKAVLLKLKAYAEETEQTFENVIKTEFEAFEQTLLNKAREIDEIRFKAIEEMKKQRDEQELAAQFPLKVPGHEVDPIANEPEITA